MKKVVPWMVFLVFLSIFCGFVVAAELPAIPPVPEEFKAIKVVKPDPSVPKEIADFIGEWEGVWKYVGFGSGSSLSFGQEVRRAKFIIYEASASGKIKFLYGVGVNPHSAGKSGWRMYEADVTTEGGYRYFSFFPPSGYALHFDLKKGLLLGSQGKSYEIELQRVK